MQMLQLQGGCREALQKLSFSPLVLSQVRSLLSSSFVFASACSCSWLHFRYRCRHQSHYRLRLLFADRSSIHNRIHSRKEEATETDEGINERQPARKTE